MSVGKIRLQEVTGFCIFFFDFGKTIKATRNKAAGNLSYRNTVYDNRFTF